MSESLTSLPAPGGQPASTNRLVWGLAVSQIISWGTLYYPLSLMAGPMEAELGWSRTELNGALTTGLLIAGLCAIPVGHWVNRHGARGVMTIAAVVGALLLALWSTATSLPLFYLIWIGLGLVQSGTLGDIVYAVLVANVADYKKAVTHLTLVTGVAGAIAVPTTNWGIAHFGWRHTLQILAVFQLVGPALIHLLVLRGTQSDADAQPPTEDSPVPLMTVLRSLFSRADFWGLTVCFGAQGFVASGIVFHLVPLMHELGFSQDAAVTVITILGPTQVLARLATHVLSKHETVRTLGRITVLLLPSALTLLIIVAPLGFPGLWLFSTLYGLTSGLWLIVRATGIAEILGARGYALSAMAITFSTLLPRTFGPLAIASIWDATHSYMPALWILVGMTSIGAAAFWLVTKNDKGGSI